MFVLHRVSQDSLIYQAADMNSKSRVSVKSEDPWEQRGIHEFIFVSFQMWVGVSGFFVKELMMLVKEVEGCWDSFSYSK